MRLPLRCAARLLTFTLAALPLAVDTATALAAPAATYVTIEKPAENTSILIVRPEVTLGMLTAAGTFDRREDWSQDARKYLHQSMVGALSDRKYKTSSTEVTQFEDSRDVQLLKLNAAVADSIAMNSAPIFALPTKTTFDWTLGEGAAELAPAGDGDKPAYILFLQAQGTFSSGGRAALMVGMMALGVGVPMGGQSINASLVDLKSGRVVWYQTYVVAPGTDIRTAEGATVAVKYLLKNLPL